MLGLFFIVEGYSEELFIKNSLTKYLCNKNKPSNNYIKTYNLNGGVSLTKLKTIINNVIKQYDYVTTMFDLVRLESSGFTDYPRIIKSNDSSDKKANLLERQLANHVPAQLKDKFIPYIQPYEFEALCFSDCDSLAYDPQIEKHLNQIRKVVKEYDGNPESINNTNYPAKRLKNFGYVKELPTFANHCNIEVIRNKCPHFNNWLNKLEALLDEE